jgi:phosphopantetheine--protein transferase-like protein
VATATATEAEELSEADRVAMTQRGSVRRQADRLAGQLAGRRAAAPIAGGALRRDPLGAPFVEGSTAGVSISHQQGEALAIAMEGARVGVDIESVEPRDPAFLSTWFSPEERVLLHDDASVASAWAIKEAVLKALGMGMRLPPQQIQILRLQPPRVDLQGEVDARHRLIGGTTLRIRRGWWKKRVLAFASLRVAI